MESWIPEIELPLCREYNDMCIFHLWCKFINLLMIMWCARLLGHPYQSCLKCMLQMIYGCFCNIYGITKYNISNNKLITNLNDLGRIISFMKISYYHIFSPKILFWRINDIYRTHDNKFTEPFNKEVQNVHF